MAGGVDRSPGSPPTVILDRWDGRRWTGEADDSGGAGLNGLSCTSPRFCLGVESLEFTGSGIAHWSGRRWFFTSTRGELASVSCVSSTWCVAVGTTDDADHLRIEHWNGARWATDTAPSLLHTSLAGVSCTTRSACVAVGQGTCDPVAMPSNCDPLAARTTTEEREDRRLRRL
jgi:hypothetical protein